MLALLVLNAGRPVAMGTIIDELWGEQEPQSALITLRAYLSRLRSAFETAGGEQVLRRQQQG